MYRFLTQQIRLVVPKGCTVEYKVQLTHDLVSYARIQYTKENLALMGPEASRDQSCDTEGVAKIEWTQCPTFPRDVMTRCLTKRRLT